MYQRDEERYEGGEGGKGSCEIDEKLRMSKLEVRARAKGGERGDEENDTEEEKVDEGASSEQEWCSRRY